MKTGYCKLVLNLTNWTVPEKYKDFEPIGSGAFGMVCSAIDTQTGRKVAIKKLHRPFQSREHAKRAFRELILLRHMDHDNVIKLLDVFTPDETPDDLGDVYLVTPYMDEDLARILRHQQLTHEQIQTLVYQLLRGLKYIHSAGIIHRDLKPANLGIDAAECELRILDFGLARLTAYDMTGYVTTRWYRSPEILFNWTTYDQTADIWSVGCIMAEMVNGRPLFPGKTYLDQLEHILAILGTPDDEFMDKLTTDESRAYIRERFPSVPKRDVSHIFEGASSATIDLLERMLVLDPSRRITAAEALAHPYFGDWHDPDDEPTAAPMVDLAFEEFNVSIHDWRDMIWTEIKHHETRLEVDEQSEKSNSDC